MDDADRAEEMQRFYLDAAIERQRARPAGAHGGAHCLSCGGPIPEARKKALPGAAFCAGCQNEFERSATR